MEPTLYYCNTCESPVTEVEKKNHVLTCKKCNEPFVNIIDSDDSKQNINDVSNSNINKPIFINKPAIDSFAKKQKKKLTAEQIRQKRKKRAMARKQRILRAGDTRFDYIRNKATKNELNDAEQNQIPENTNNKSIDKFIDISVSILSDFPSFLNTIADDDTKAIEPTTIQENDSSSTITKCNNDAVANDATFGLNSFSTPLAQYYRRKPKKRSTSKNNSRFKPNMSQQFGKAIKRNDTNQETENKKNILVPLTLLVEEADRNGKSTGKRKVQKTTVSMNNFRKLKPYYFSKLIAKLKNRKQLQQFLTTLLALPEPSRNFGIVTFLHFHSDILSCVTTEKCIVEYKLKDLTELLKKKKCEIFERLLYECGFAKCKNDQVITFVFNDVNLHILQFIYISLIEHMYSSSTFTVYDSVPDKISKADIQIGLVSFNNLDIETTDIKDEIMTVPIPKEVWNKSKPTINNRNGNLICGNLGSNAVYGTDEKPFILTRKPPFMRSDLNNNYNMQRKVKLLHVDCISDLVHCNHFQRLKHSIIQYKKTDTCQTDIQQIVNDNIHVQMRHIDNDQRKEIYNKFGGQCDRNNCKIFNRYHFRHSQRLDQPYNDTGIDHNDETNDIVKRYIMDKIHYYYSHSCEVDDKAMQKEKRLTQSKRFITTPNDIDIKEDESNKFVSNQSIFSFGFQYMYVSSLCYQPLFNILTVNKKYSNIKEEVLNNEQERMTLKQFHAEYYKVKVHLSSLYCKNYIATIEKQKFNTAVMLKDKKWSVHHLLALSIHCNFDKLCTEINNTYRRLKMDNNELDIAKRHQNFFWCCKYMADAIEKWGEPPHMRQHNTYYHGVNTILAFPDLFGGTKKTVHEIYAPLSTTYCCEVACNFMGPNGLVVEFGSNDNDKNKYFCVEWFSDFPKEHELLFVMSAPNLQINNITMTNELTVIQFNVLLNSLRRIMQTFCLSNKSQLGTLKKVDKTVFYYHLKLESYDSLKEVHQNHHYGKELIYNFFRAQSDIYVNWKTITQYDWLFKQICYSINDGKNEINWIKLNVLQKIFPKMKKLEISGVKFYSFIFDDIVNYLKNQKGYITRITFDKVRNGDEYAKAYGDEFKKIEFEIEIEEKNKERVYIKKFCLDEPTVVVPLY